MNDRPSSELTGCEVVSAPLRARGRASFQARVSRLLRLGYKPLGAPHYPDSENAVLTLVKDDAGTSKAAQKKAARK